MRTASSLVCTLLACILAACSGSSTRPDDAGTIPERDAWMPPPRDAGPPPDPPAPIDCATDPHASFAGSVNALRDRAPIAGAQVCVIDHPEITCATTDSSGNYTLGCAPLGDSAISFEASGFAHAAWMWRGAEGASTPLNVSLVTGTENTAYFAPVGVTYPDGSSALVTIDAVGNAAGLVAGLRTGAGEGPFFSADEGGRIDPGAGSLSGENEFVFFVARPDPGWSEIEIALVPPAGTACAQIDSAWSARDSTPNVVRVKIAPGMESVIWVRCG